MGKLKVLCVVILVAVSLCYAYDYPADLNGFLGTGTSNPAEYESVQSWHNPDNWSYGHVPLADENVATFLCSPLEPWQLHIAAPAVGANLFMQGTNGDAGDHIYIFDGGSLTIGGTFVMGPTVAGAANWGASIPKHIPEVYINAGGSLFVNSLQVAGDQGRELRMWVNGSLDVGEIRVYDLKYLNEADGTTTNYLSMILQDGIADIGAGTINEAGTGSAGSLVSIDITGGTLIVDDTGFYADVAAGVILANGVTVTTANMSTLLIVDSTTSPGNVVVTVNNHAVFPDYAWAPSPADGLGGVAVNSSLSWSPGDTAISHDVYFGISESLVTGARRLAGDINGDRSVDISDLSLLAAQWLTNPGAVNHSADVEFSGKVDFEDFAVVAADWGQDAPLEFKGNQLDTTYVPALSENTTYYWRIDEVNASDADSPWIGTVWSFTTKPPQPTRYFGYLYTYFDYYGGYQPLNDIPTVAGYTNMNHILVWFGGESTNGIQTAIANNTKVLLDVKFVCFQESPTSYHDFDLRPDWETRLNTFKAQYAQYKDHIAALTPMDEPYWHGVTRSEVEQVATKLRADFPGIPIYLNLYKSGFTGLSSYPAGIDWVAVDTFDLDPFDYNEFLVCLNHLKNIKTSSQKIILNIPNMNGLGSDSQLAGWAWNHYNLMQNDSDIIGALIWLGDTYRKIDYAGETDLPQNKAALESIGHLITGK